MFFDQGLNDLGAAVLQTAHNGGATPASTQTSDDVNLANVIAELMDIHSCWTTEETVEVLQANGYEATNLRVANALSKDSRFNLVDAKREIYEYVG